MLKGRLGGLICVLALLGCTDNTSSAVPELATMKVRIAPLIDSVHATGRIQTVVSVDVSSQISGRIDAVYVDFNDIIAAGQPLAQLDQQRFQSRVAELNAALAVAQAEFQSVEAALIGSNARFDEDQRDYQRKADLSRQGSVSDSEMSRSKAVMHQSESALKSLEASRSVHVANIAAASAALKQAEIDLERTTITAPIDGILIKRSIEPGQTVAASLSAPELFTIANDLREIEVHARVDEADIGKVSVGQAVVFQVDAYPGRSFEGIVRQIRKAPEISQGVVSYFVIVSGSNPDELMLPGMTALVEIVTSRKDDVIQVPNAALRFQMPAELFKGDSPPGANVLSATSVWIVESNQKYVRRNIDIGYSDGEFSEVRSDNLSPGDTVVVGFQR